MIKTPVSVGSIGTSNYHTSSCYPLLIDANFKPLNNECAKEAAKRINMHDELVDELEQIKIFLDEIHVMPVNWITKEGVYRHAVVCELLERCK